MEKKELKTEFKVMKLKILTDFLLLFNYLDTSDKLIGEHLDIIAKKIKNNDNEIKAEDNIVTVEKVTNNVLNSADRHINYTIIKKYFYSSCLIMVYSLFEDTAKKIAKMAKEISGSKLKYSEIRESNDVVKVKKYLEKHLNFDMSSKNSIWIDLRNFTKVRNQLVHKITSIDSEDELFEFLKKDDRIDLINEHIVIKNLDYVKDFFKKASEYTRFMCDLLEHKYLNED